MTRESRVWTDSDPPARRAGGSNHHLVGPFRRRLLMKLAVRDGWECWWCGRPLVNLNDYGHSRYATEAGARRAQRRLDQARAKGRRDPTIDHVIPKSRGGPRRDRGNLVIACRQCNHLRGDTLKLPRRLVGHIPKDRRAETRRRWRVAMQRARRAMAATGSALER